jgi:tyrosine-protein kinase Etk/Wzc
MTEQETILLNQFSKAKSEPLPTAGSEDSLIDVLALLLSHQKLIGAVTLAATAIAAVVAFFLPPSYIAEATILPPQQQSSSLAALASGAMGGLAAGMGSQLGLKNPADIYIGILKCRTVSDEIIRLFHLDQVYGTDLLSKTRKSLSRHAEFAASKESIISISVRDHDPKRAAAMANAFIDELYKLNSRLAITEASQRRLFFEQELRAEKDALADAEIGLKTTQQATGLLMPAGQAEVLIRTGAQLRAEIAASEVQLQALRSYETDENSQIQILKREIAALRDQAGRVEASGASDSKLEVSGTRLPEATLQYVRKMRDLKYHETLFELLAKQYEVARVDEAKQAPVIQVIDRAIVPDRDSRNRWALVAAAALLGLVLTSLFVLSSEPMRQLGKALRQSSEGARLGRKFPYSTVTNSNTEEYVK